MTIDAGVFAAVLLAAALHAGWNAVVKTGLDRFLSITLISVASGVVALAFAPFVDFPNSAALPWMLTSVVLHQGYYRFLLESYRTGDFGQVYPIARGTAPLFVLIPSVLFIGERFTTLEVVGILMLTAGVICMSLRGGREIGRIEVRAVLSALATSAFIAAYTLSDALGARANGSPHGYAVWLFIVNGAAMAVLLLAMRGRTGVREIGAYWRGGLAGGAMSLAAYWIVIWAVMTAPIAPVSALRETSVLFAAAISAAILREPLSRWRLGAAVMIVAGVVLTRVA